MDDSLFVRDVHLAHYAMDIDDIVAKIQEAVDAADQAADLVAGEGFYQGEAREVLTVFFTSLATHAGQLIMFDQVAGQYLIQVIRKFGEADDELKKVMDWLEFESQPQPVRGPQR